MLEIRQDLELRIERGGEGDGVLHLLYGDVHVLADRVEKGGRGGGLDPYGKKAKVNMLKPEDG